MQALGVRDPLAGEFFIPWGGVGKQKQVPGSMGPGQGPSCSGLRM